MSFVDCLFVFQVPWPLLPFFHPPPDQAMAGDITEAGELYSPLVSTVCALLVLNLAFIMKSETSKLQFKFFLKFSFAAPDICHTFSGGFILTLSSRLSAFLWH